MVKRVAGVGLRYQSTSHNSPIPPINTNSSINQPQDVTVNNSSHTAAVTTNNTNSSPPQGLRPQPECIPPDAQLVPPEEDTSVPVHPLEKLTIALDNVKVTIHNMMSKIKQTLVKMYKIYMHKTVAQQQVLNHAHWHNVKLYLLDVDPETLHNIIQTVSAPLLDCIREHYTNSTITTINNTYLTIHNENNAHLTEQMITCRIQESTLKMITHLKDINNNNNTNINNSTITQSQDTNTTTNSTTTQSQDTNTTTNNTSHTNSQHTTANTTHKHSNRANRPSLKNRSKRIKSKHTPEQCLNPNCLLCAELNIVNLSNVVLTDTQKLLLNKGLSFVPTAPNSAQLFNDERSSHTTQTTSHDHPLWMNNITTMTYH